MYVPATGSSRNRYVEHRYSARKPMNLPVEVFHHKQSLGCFNTQDVSHQGAFIDASQLYLFCNDFVQVKFFVGDQLKAREFKLKALVRHMSKQGIGVMFTDDLPDFFRVLQGLLSTAAPQGKAAETSATPLRRDKIFNRR